MRKSFRQSNLQTILEQKRYNSVQKERLLNTNTEHQNDR